MNSLNWFGPANLLDPQLCFQLTITLLHFLWQGAVIVAVVVVANWCLRGSAARIRYTVGVEAMLLMVGCLPVTFAILHLTQPGAALPIETVTRFDATEHSADDHAPPLAGFDERQASLKLDPRFDDASSNAVPNDLRPAPGDDDMMVAVVASHEQSDGSRALMRFSPHATIAYLLGVALMMLRLGIALWSGRRLRKRVAVTKEQHLLAFVRRRACAIGMKVLPTVAYCERIAVPVVVGIVKPTIVLPATLLTGLEPGQLEAIITHELAHVVRFDLLVNLFQRVVESLLFFHPAVWFICHRVSAERGNCCDDLVAQDDKAFSQAVTKITRTDTAWPPLTLYPQKEGDVLLYKNLPPGRYSISASRRADRYDGLRYETVDDVEVEIAVGATREVRLALQGRSLTEEEKNARAPWIAMGRVTDADGNPIAGAEIWAPAGWGSLSAATLATTDEDGRYRGRFAQSGVRAMNLGSDALNLVSGQVGAYKDGMYEANLNRQGGMHADFRLPKPGEEVPDDVDTDRLYIRGQPREVNFVLLPAAEVVVQVLDAEDRPLGTKRLTLDGK